MRQLLVSFVLLIVLAANLQPAIAQATNPAQGNPGAKNVPAAAVPDGLEPPQDKSGRCEVVGELPKPTLTEPFAIGEALYDPAQVDVAVVSLLDLMGIGIDKADGTPLRAARRSGATFRLTEPEVRSLILMGRADAAAASRKGRPPYSFKDLHGAVAPLLPDFSIGRLAAAYAEAYQENPDGLAPQVLMGQPIETNTRLMRTQIWLLLVDGFVPPKSGGPAPAWGTASTKLPPLPPPIPGWNDSDWQDLIARLPLLAWQPPLDLAPQPARGHEGHGGPGATVMVTARIGDPRARGIVPSRGLALLKPRTQGFGDRQVTWNANDAAVLLEHGAPSPEPGSPSMTDTAGNARLSYVPKAEAANGRGRLAGEAIRISATISQWDLVSARYEIPAQLRGFLIGDVTTCGALEIGFHLGGTSQGSGTPGGRSQMPELIKIKITNTYDVVLNMGPLGGGTRKGEDGVEGTIKLQADGTYRGTVKGYAKGTQEVHGLGMGCGPARSEGTQDLLVIGTPTPSFGPLHKASEYVWASGQPAGWLSLEFFPTTRAAYTQRDNCQTEIQQTEDPNLPWFLPYNDAQWTIRHTGYGMAYPRSGQLVYKDNFSASTIVGTSVWDVTVESR